MQDHKKNTLAILLRRWFRFLVISSIAVILILVGCRSNTMDVSPSNKGSLSPNSTKTIASTSLPPESIKADLGFRPTTNGFNFSNYTNENGIKNLSVTEMQRMFGNNVCANQGNPCILTPPAEKWMEEVNKSMNGGHCEGMAALSLILYADKDKTSKFGNVPDLSLLGNEMLQHEIAYWFATQYVPPTSLSEMKGKQVPSDILGTLLASLKPNARVDQTYTMGIYQPNFKGGHAITPYAVGDLGNGKYAVLVYDNNYPIIERILEIDRNENTWQYNASTNPDEPESVYIGDAETKTLTLTPTPPRYEQQVCNFCDLEYQPDENSNDKSAIKGNANSTPKFNQIFLEGDADLLINNGNQKIGYENEKFVNSFPGATFKPIKSSELWKDDNEPVYNIPVGVPFTINLQGNKKSNPKESIEVVMIGSSYDVGLSDIKILPNQKDLIQFSQTGRSLIYKPSSSEAPNIFFGISTDLDDYEFELDGVEIDAGGTISSNLDTNKGRLGIKISETKNEAVFDLLINRIDDKAKQTFKGKDLKLASGDTLYLDYAKWTGNGAKLTIELDKGSDGTIEETTTIDDQKK
jgi:hypothetical protein